MSFRNTLTSIAALLALSAVAPAARAATTGDNGTHDPSRIIESDGKFYFCGTGGRCASSTDGLAWKQTGLQIGSPSWAGQYVNANGQTQGIWAPDIVFYNGKYYIYYSFCGTPAAHAPCAIGVLTTPTLDSTSPSYKLTDGGKVVNNPPNTTGYQFSTIDPAPIVDATGNLWSSWGSGYGKDTSKLQIYVTRMGGDGLPLASDSGYMPPMTLGYGLETGGIEGSYVHYHGGYYYLFWNSGGCCDGAASTYTIHVARSQTISGPYTGAKVWYSSNGSIHGPGHMGVYNACGVERFTYHYYPDSGGSVLGENELSWGSDGWPVPGAPSTTALKPCGNPTSDPSTGGASGSGGVAGSSGNDAGGTNSTTSGGTTTDTGGSFASGGSGGTTPSAGGAATTVGGATGSAAAVGGTSSAGSDALAPAGGAPADAGCSCALPGCRSGNHPGQLPFALSAAFAALLIGARRRRQRSATGS